MPEITAGLGESLRLHTCNRIKVLISAENDRDPKTTDPATLICSEGGVLCIFDSGVYCPISLTNTLLSSSNSD